MSALRVKDLTDQIDRLLADLDSMKSRSIYDDLSDLRDESDAIVVRLHAALERLAPGANAYAKEMASVSERNSRAHRIFVYAGILRALRADASEGWLDGISELLHADTFDDLLDQASELAGKDYKDAAAVISGSALEAHIRLLCERYQIDTRNSSGHPKRLTQ